MRGRVVPSLPMLMILGEELKKARERANSSTERTRPEPSQAEAEDDAQNAIRRAA